MRARTAIALLVPVLALPAACGGGGSTPPAAEPPVEVTSGDVTVRVDPGALDVSVRRAGATLLHFPADGIELGTLSSVDDATDYDPMVFYAPTAIQPAPDDIQWLAVTSIHVTEAAADHVTAALSFAQGAAATLRVDAAKPGAFKATLTPSGPVAGLAYYRLRSRSSPTEGFYGLGEYYDAVSHRGRVRSMQLRVDSDLESGYNEAHVPIPFVIGTTGWGLFVETQRPGAFSVAPGDNPSLAGASVADKDLVEATFGTGTASGQGLTFHLFGEGHPLDVTRHYYDVTGYPRLPARWALGPWVWRDEVTDQAQAEGDLQTMRDLDLAATGYWYDRPYATGVETFDWDPAKFTDPAAMLAKQHDLGFRAALWHTPYLDEKDPNVASLFTEATQKGFYPRVTSLKLNKWGNPLDLTNPAAYAWWQQHLETYTAMGIEGFKLDYGEDIVPGLTTARNTWEFSDGSDERTMHMGYTLLYHRVYDEVLPGASQSSAGPPKDGGFLLCRHGDYGDQTHVSVIWPGDLDVGFEHQRDPLPGGGTSLAVGGLPASVIAGLSLGPSGFPFYGADTGGYRGGPPDKELFTRWFEQTALSTVMQIGTEASTVAWEMTPETGYDMEMLGWYRTYTRLHLRLFPYEWTYAKNLATDGRAITRPLGLAFPELGQHPDDEYMFGDALLVAPVMERGAVKRSVIFPAGRWIGWWDGASYDGGQTVQVDAPLGTLPLFLAEGGIVPLLRPTIDTTAPTTLPAQVDSYDTTPGVLYVRVAPGPKSSFTVFDGAVLGQEQDGKTLNLSTSDGAELKLGTMFEVIGVSAKPTGVTDGGTALAEVATLADLEAAPSGWTRATDTGGTVWVKTGPGTHAIVVTSP